MVSHPFKINCHVTLDTRSSLTGSIVFRLPLVEVSHHPGAGPYGFSVGRWEVAVLSYTDTDRFKKLAPDSPDSALGSNVSIFSNQLEGTSGHCPLTTASASELKKKVRKNWDPPHFFPLRQGLEGDLFFILASADGQALKQATGFKTTSLLLTVSVRKSDD